jgi:hypothetical protein
MAIRPRCRERATARRSWAHSGAARRPSASAKSWRHRADGGEDVGEGEAAVPEGAFRGEGEAAAVVLKSTRKTPGGPMTSDDRRLRPGVPGAPAPSGRGAMVLTLPEPSNNAGQVWADMVRR